MGRPHAKRAKPIMQQGPSNAQKQIAKSRGTRQLKDKPRSVDDMARKTKKGQTNLRDRATVKRLLMYREKAPEHRIRPESAMRQAKVAPNRKWFGNTRVIGQKELANFREELKEKVNDPYTVLLKGKKLPMSLLEDPKMTRPVKMLDVEPFEETFSKNRKRKRPKLAGGDYAELLAKAGEADDNYDAHKDSNIDTSREYSEAARENIFFKGQSKRIWAELHKVVDSSDVIIQVLDVRDPMGTRCKYVEQLLKRASHRHKHLVLLLNKCDLVPTWVTARWIKLLSKEYPTLAFHASITNPFGKGALIQLLRQFRVLHQDKKHLSVGFFGYPNVGKSSVINALRKKRVCKAAPMPGETKVWQYVTLFRAIYLIDCPGTVYGTNDDDTTTVMKGVVRVENIDMPSQYVGGVLERVKKQYVARTYMLPDWKDAEDFLERLARASGKLLKGNEPDIETTAKMVLNDMIRGKLPFFVEPPEAPKEGFGYKKGDLRSKVEIERQKKFEAANRPSEMPEASAAEKSMADQPVGPANRAESDEENEEEHEEIESAEMPTVKQKLSKMVCTHRFDEDDMRRGDADLEDDEEGAESSGEEDEDDEDEPDEDEDEEGEEGEEGVEQDGDPDDSGSDVSLNDGEEDSEDDEDAAAEAAWAEMELESEAQEAGGGVGKTQADEETKKKINRTLMRRKRKAAQIVGAAKKLTWNEKRVLKQLKKPKREDMIPGHEADEVDVPYRKRPRPGRKAIKHGKIGSRFYDNVDVKNKRKKSSKKGTVEF